MEPGRFLRISSLVADGGAAVAGLENGQRVIGRAAEQEGRHRRLEQDDGTRPPAYGRAGLHIPEVQGFEVLFS